MYMAVIHIHEYKTILNISIICICTVKSDEHFAPASHLCNPCQLDFDYYGNFQTLTEDIHTVLDRIGAPRWLLPKLKEHSTLSTEDLMDLYFGDMSEEERLSLRRSLEDKTGYNFEGAPTERFAKFSPCSELMQYIHNQFTAPPVFFHCITSLSSLHTHVNKYEYLYNTLVSLFSMTLFV